MGDTRLLARELREAVLKQFITFVRREGLLEGQHLGSL